MIRKITFSNFYSFFDQQVVDFTASKKKSYDYFNSDFGDQITKVAGFAGPNASGKTNVMKIFGFISYFITKSSKDTSKEYDVAYHTFFDNSKPSSVDLEFEYKGNIYFYAVSILRNKVEHEGLSFIRAAKHSKKTVLFLRKSSGIEKINKVYFKGTRISVLETVRPDTSLIAHIGSNYSVEVVDTILEYFRNFQINFNEAGDLNTDSHKGRSISIYLKNPKIKKQMEQFVRNFDIGLSGFDIEEKEKKHDHSFVNISGKHSFGKVVHFLNFKYESKGTQSIFFVLAKILFALDRQSVVVLDELETGLHPEAFTKIIQYFIDENANKGAQMIFSSHSFGFMAKLDMHQMYLVDKDNQCRSSVSRLSRVKGVRPDANHLSKYMSGSYGAFPHIKV